MTHIQPSSSREILDVLASLFVRNSVVYDMPAAGGGGHGHGLVVVVLACLLVALA